ncbi:acyltransferase family protein [Micrococcales bacterium 31B]|nr:acyltransferase family protein [Micrococcales bacterium 31B]
MPAARAATATRVPALDGLRALAVVLVLLYHVQVPGFEGGFVGVEIFFVLSGFLITWLLMRAFQRVTDGEATLREVWLDFFYRRARRLLPPLVVMLIVVTVVWMVWRPQQYDVVRQDALAALLNLQNWWFIVHDVSYADAAGGQSPLLHLWSLSIEEQFYIVWPAILFSLAVALRKTGLQRWNRSVVVVVLLSACVASGYLLYLLGHSAADPSAAYFNTFARACALLSGAALALARMNRGHQGRGGGRQELGWVLVAGLLVCTVLLRETGHFTYAGGLFIVDVATVLLIATLVARPRGNLSRVFAHPVGAWLGARSYAIYIWHWPLVIWFDQNQATGWAKVGYGAAVVGLSIVFAEFSWWLIERPSRFYGRKTFYGFATATALAAVFAIVVPYVKPYSPPSYLTNAAVHFVAPTGGSAGGSAGGSTGGSAASGTGEGTVEPTGSTAPTDSSDTESTDTDTPATSSGGTSTDPDAQPSSDTDTENPADASEPGTPTTEASTPPPVTKPTDCGVSFVGDSVMLAAQQQIFNLVPNVRSFDGQVGMQFDPGMAAIRTHLNDGSLGCVVVIGLGTNGSYNKQGIINFVDALPATSRVVLVNTQAPRSWTGWVNDEIIAAQAARPTRISIADWQTYALANPSQLAQDHIHMGSVATEQAYVQIVLAAVQASGAGTPAA